MVIDPKALVEAFDKVSKEKLRKEIHEWVVYTAPINVHEIYKAYLELVEKKEEEKEEYSFVVSDWGVEGPRFRSEQNDWPPVGTRFVSVKETKW
jgi:hypothetical protein